MTTITWVAEIGSSHKGNPSLAYELIRQFYEAGATIAKFQFGWTKAAQEAVELVYSPVRYVDEWADDIAAWCRYFGIELMASIWSLEGLITAKNVGMKRYKISRRLWTRNLELTKAIVDDGKPVFISFAPNDDLSKFPYANNVTPVTVNPLYPTYPKDIIIPKFGVVSCSRGYSEHSHGIAPCLMAVAHGAQYIEKHVCISKDDLVTKDTPFSATPAEFEQMVKLGNEMRRVLDAWA